MDSVVYYPNSMELYHHGMKGQRWGYRRWQNPDGSLTPAGREHYGKGLPRLAKAARGNRLKSAKRAADRNRTELEGSRRNKKQAALDNTIAKGKAAGAKSDYINAKNRAEKAILFKGAWNKEVKRTEKALQKANDDAGKAQRLLSEISGEVAQLESNQIKLDAVEKRRADKYIKRYDQMTYNELMNSMRK